MIIFIKVRIMCKNAAGPLLYYGQAESFWMSLGLWITDNGWDRESSWMWRRIRSRRWIQTRGGSAGLQQPAAEEDAPTAESDLNQCFLWTLPQAEVQIGKSEWTNVAVCFCAGGGVSATPPPLGWFTWCGGPRPSLRSSLTSLWSRQLSLCRS